MKNKVNLRKWFIWSVIIGIVLIVIFTFLNFYEYKVYTKNYNKKINQIVGIIQEKYPKVTDEQIAEILNDSSNQDEKNLEKYGIDESKDSAILKNENEFYKFLIINLTFLAVAILSLLLEFTKYNKKQEKEIDEITKYIEEINRKNYDLKIDSISEDELSILKNEIYKTMVTLKENSENSMNDKLAIKKSLEDISHQLKTPLTSITIMLDNLIDDPNMDEKTRLEFVLDIKRNLMNINFLVQSLLKLSKFDSNTIDFNRKNIKISEIIEESLKNVSALCDLKNIKIEVNGNKNLEFYVDEKWQIEAITNILKNGIDHSKENRKIEINFDQNKIYSEIKIKDYGEGIDKNDLPHIFERFYKGKNSGKDSLGIGLALSKSIIEEDNGKIEVNSSNSRN